MRLHDLCYGAASLLVGAGVHPRIAQELLRHASSKTTMEIYSHVSGAQQREAVEVLQRALAESHAESHAKSNLSGAEWPRVEPMGEPERESGSCGTERTCVQAVNPPRGWVRRDSRTERHRVTRGAPAGAAETKRTR